MRLDVHHYFHQDSDVKLDQILALLGQIKQGEASMAADLTALTTAVNDEVTVEESAIALITQLRAEIIAAGTDPVALQALTDSLNTEKDNLAAAVANTPTP